MNVDEMSLINLFSPFGEIEYITRFLVHTYAFVQLSSVVETGRDKETLQWKLFSSP